MTQALLGGSVDLIGLGRPLCIDPTLPHRLLTGDDTVTALSSTTQRVTGKLLPRSMEKTINTALQVHYSSLIYCLYQCHIYCMCWQCNRQCIL
jgi:hypothetical protein